MHPSDSQPPRLPLGIQLKDFTAAQHQVLFELLVLAMYADGHLTATEDAQLHALLAAMGYAEDFDRRQVFAAAVTRVRPHTESLEKAKHHALKLAEAFAEKRQQQQVFAAVQTIMMSDREVSAWETTLLSELRLKFRL